MSTVEMLDTLEAKLLVRQAKLDAVADAADKLSLSEAKALISDYTSVLRELWNVQDLRRRVGV